MSAGTRESYREQLGEIGRKAHNAALGHPDVNEPNMACAEAVAAQVVRDIIDQAFAQGIDNLWLHKFAAELGLDLTDGGDDELDPIYDLGAEPIDWMMP